MAFTVQDHYFRKAKKEHFLARAIYKLEEIQKRFKILKAADRVLDLGAAPGSWIQLAGPIVGGAGLVVGIDLKPIEHAFPKYVVTLQGDIFDQGFVETALRDHVPFNVVLSDMAPSTSGIKAPTPPARRFFSNGRSKWPCGRWRLEALFWLNCFTVLSFTGCWPRPRNTSGLTRIVRPEATRKQSREIYILAMDMKK